MFKKLFHRKKKTVKFEFEKAPDVEEMVAMLLKKLPLHHVKADNVFCLRSQGSKARAYARIWGLQRVFQIAAGYKPTYVIEVISKYYDKLSHKEQVKVIIHELLHIPKTFSGALKSHRGVNHRVDDREVEKWFKTIEIN